MEQTNLVPKRRFKEFQNTRAWEQRKLGEMSNRFEYGLNASATFFDGINKYIRITDIDDNSRLFNQGALTSPDVDLSNADNYLIKKGDILFARTGASVGKTYRYQESDGKVYYAGFLIRARINQDFDSEFVFQNTLTPKYDNFIKITSQRSGQPGVNAQEYASFDLMVPTLEEQQKIGTFFKDLDGTIALHQRKLEKTKALKSAYLSEMLPAEGEREPKRRFAGFTQAWEQRKLGELADFSKGNGYSKSNLTDEGKPIILYGRLYTKYETVIEFVDTFTIEKEKSIISKGNEVIVPASGEASEDISRASVVSKPGVILGGDLNIVRPSNEIEPVFLALTISNGKQQKELSKRAQGKSVVHLQNSDLKEVNLVFPIKEEQKKIGVFLKQLDNTIAIHQRKLEKLKNIKKAYLNEMFV